MTEKNRRIIFKDPTICKPSNLPYTVCNGVDLTFNEKLVFITPLGNDSSPLDCGLSIRLANIKQLADELIGILEENGLTGR